MTARPRIGVFLNGVPDFETLFPVMAPLAGDGRVELVTYATSAMMRREPRIAPLLKDAGIAPRVWPNRILKVFHRPFLRSFDIHLGLGDPFVDYSAHGKRMRTVAATGMPCIFLQHGVVQEDVTYTDRDGPVPHYSQLLLLFDPPDRAVLGDAADRTRAVGFLKPPVFAPKRPAPAVQTALARFAKRVLFCHSFRWTDRFSGDQIKATYAMIEGFARAHSDIAVILRGHRGKRRAEYEALDKALAAACPNLFFSYQHSGPLKGLSMTDAVALSDLVISTASTALLDALYMGRPVAAYLNDAAVFDGLPQIRDLHGLTDFVAAPDSAAAGCAALRDRFGTPDRNVDRAATLIADFAVGHHHGATR